MPKHVAEYANSVALEKRHKNLDTDCVKMLMELFKQVTASEEDVLDKKVKEANKSNSVSTITNFRLFQHYSIHVVLSCGNVLFSCGTGTVHM